MTPKLSNAPVYFTISQVVFNPILSLESYLPSIQESFRRLGYEDFKQLSTFNFNLMVSAGESPPTQSPPQLVPVIRYSFANMAGTSGFILAHNMLAFQTTEYDTFDKFSEILIQGIELIHKAVTIGYWERVGLRYLDWVYPRDGENVALYIAPEIKGLYETPGGTLVYSYSETVMQTAVGTTTTSRAIIQDGGIAFPPDLSSHGLTVADRFARLNGLHVAIDIDGSFVDRMVFDSRSIMTRLDNLHEEIWKSFKATVTPHALSVWK